MNMLTEKRIVSVARWIARALALFLLGLIAAFAVGEGVPNPLLGSVSEHLLFVAMLALLIGLIAAWKWEGWGSLLILGGFALFAIVNRGVPLNVVYGPWLMIGLLFLFCWWRTRRTP